MPTTTVTGQFADATLKVENTWLHGVKLFKDGVLLATNKNLLALHKDVPLISIPVAFGDQQHLVEVFAFSLITIKLQLRVNGAFLAGDQL